MTTEELPPIDTLWEYDDPVGSEARFRERAESETGEIWLELQSQIARALGLQGKLAEGHQVLDEIESKVAGRQLVRYLLERGRLFNSAGDPERAVTCFREADAEAQVGGEVTLRIDALHMLGIAAPEDQRDAWNLSAIKIAEESNRKEARVWLGSLLNNLAWTYFDQREFAKALDLFDRALIWHQEFGTVRTQQIARYSVGCGLRACGRAEEAFALQMALAVDIGDERPNGYVYEEIAENLFELGRTDESRQWFKKAFDESTLDLWFVGNEPDRLAHLETMSDSDDG